MGAGEAEEPRDIPASGAGAAVEMGRPSEETGARLGVGLEAGTRWLAVLRVSLALSSSRVPSSPGCSRSEAWGTEVAENRGKGMKQVEYRELNWP